MSIFDRFRREEKANQFESVLMRLIAAEDGVVNEMVTPDTCMQSPTVHAIVTSVSRRLSVTPIHVYQKKTENGKESKQKLPDHPVSRLLRKPNVWQSPVEFWQDAASCMVRWGCFYAFKSGSGKAAELIPLNPKMVMPKFQENYRPYYVVTENGQQTDYAYNKILHARGPARDFLRADSPVKDVQLSIMMEIMAEKFGESFLRNGALPLMVMKYAAGVKAFKTQEEENAFVNDFQKGFGAAKRFRALLLPKGIEREGEVEVENDKAQFLETRKYQRTVIAGAFGVPPHLVGDLERATFNNVEQQDQDFTLNVIMPVARSFESAMERDLLDDTDRASGVVIRFNLDGTLRADFKTRQEGKKIQREMGVISADEWREGEGMNPLPDGQGDHYWQQGPSGQNAGGKNAQS